MAGCGLRGDAYVRRVDAGFFGLSVLPGEPPALFSYHRGGFARSEDEGRTWTTVAVASPEVPMTSVLPEPVAPFALFGWSNRQDRLVSVDRGRSWSPATRRPGMRERVAYEVGRDEVWRTEDHGASWHRIDVTLPAKLVTALWANPAEPTQLLASSFFGGYRSTDGGMSWSRLPVTTGSWRVQFVAPFDTAGRLLATGAGVVGGGSLLYESHDDGASWSPVGFGPDHEAVIDGVAATTSPPALFTSVTSTRDRPSTTLLRSIDSGRSWQATHGARGTLAGLVEWPGRPGTLIGAFGVDGIQRSDDGGATWRPVRRQ